MPHSKSDLSINMSLTIGTGEITAVFALPCSITARRLRPKARANTPRLLLELAAADAAAENLSPSPGEGSPAPVPSAGESSVAGAVDMRVLAVSSHRPADDTGTDGTGEGETVDKEETRL